MKKLINISWQKVAIVTCLLFLFIIGYILINDNSFRNVLYTNLNKVSHPPKTYFEPSESSEGSVEELYRDIFMSFLTPYIEKAVYDYYGQPFAVDPWSPKILSIERPNGYRTFYFVIELQIIPYYGLHRGVGIDRITLSVGGSGDVKVEKFEHIKTYDIPPKPKEPINDE